MADTLPSEVESCSCDESAYWRTRALKAEENLGRAKEKLKRAADRIGDMLARPDVGGEEEPSV